MEVPDIIIDIKRGFQKRITILRIKIQMKKFQKKKILYNYLPNRKNYFLMFPLMTFKRTEILMIILNKISININEFLNKETVLNLIFNNNNQDMIIIKLI